MRMLGAMPASIQIAIAGFTVVSTLAFVVGAVYVRGGSDEIRRQLPQLAVLGLLVILAVIAVVVITSVAGDSASSAVLLVISVVLLGSWVVRARRGQGPLAIEQRRAAWRVPGFRVLVVGWIAIMIAWVVLLVLAAKAGF
jgi:hypothetical protein